jgi:hypothetical protein
LERAAESIYQQNALFIWCKQVVNRIFEVWFYFVEAGHKAQKMWPQNYAKLASES